MPFLCCYLTAGLLLQVTLANATVWEMDSCWVPSLEPRTGSYLVRADSAPSAPRAGAPGAGVQAEAVAAAQAPAAAAGAGARAAPAAAGPAVLPPAIAPA